MAIGRDPGDTAADDLRLEAVLLGMPVVERAELHPHDDHVPGRHRLPGSRVDLADPAADVAPVGVRRPIVAVGDAVGEVGHVDPAAVRPLGQRGVRCESPDSLAGRRRPADPPGERLQVRPIRVQVVRREAARSAPEIGVVEELVGVEHELAIALRAQRLQRLR